MKRRAHTWPYFTGLDLGQSQEYTAFAVLEQTRIPNPLKPGRYLKQYAVRHLERFALGTAYTEVASALAKTFDDPALQGTVLAVDQTAVGDPVVRMLRRSGIAARIGSARRSLARQSRPSEAVSTAYPRSAMNRW